MHERKKWNKWLRKMPQNPSTDELLAAIVFVARELLPTDRTVKTVVIDARCGAESVVRHELKLDVPYKPYPTRE